MHRLLLVLLVISVLSTLTEGCAGSGSSGGSNGFLRFGRKDTNQDPAQDKPSLHRERNPGQQITSDSDPDHADQK